MTLERTKNLVELYRTFRNVEELYIDSLSKGKSDTKQYIKRLVDLLYSRASIGFYNSGNLWNRIKELAQSNEQNKKEIIATLQKMLRIYYYEAVRNDNTTASSTEQEIHDFYAELRPSAYLAPAGRKTRGPYQDVTSISQMIKNRPVRDGSSIMMVVIDTPAIDFKKRDCDKVEFFLNTFPSVMISQVVPFVEVKFLSKRTQTDDIRPINFMSPLKFLLGSETDPSLSSTNPTPNSLIYDSSTLRKSEKDVDGKKVEIIDVSTGMEMFNMPQTLLNLNYDQNASPRYNPVINSTVPFGVITDVSITCVPSYKIFSYKTASIKLRIFDRSRLSEIADFLNPQLYSSTTLQLTYGFRAPQQLMSLNENLDKNGYHEFINNNMLKSELYGIKNSSVSIDNTGVASITLDLYMKGGREFSDVTPNGESISFNEKSTELKAKFAEIRQLAKDLKLSRVFDTQKDIRGSIVISSSQAGTFPDIEAKELIKELNGIKSSLKTLGTQNPDPKFIAKINDFNTRIDEIYKLKPKKKKGEKQKYKEQEILQQAAEQIIKSRFEPLKPDSDGNTYDVFTYVKADKHANDDQSVKEQNVPNYYFKGILGSNLKEKAKYNDTYGGFGSVSFGRVFFTYFSSACLGFSDVETGYSLADEYQILFYNLNRNAGVTANLNIAEFPIDMQALEKAYTDRVIKQGGENMTLLNFLEIIRETQFDDIRHPAFGFSDLYETKEGEVVLKESDSVDYGQQLLQRNLTINKNTTNEPFVQPVIDFYVESSVDNVREEPYDLLSVVQGTTSPVSSDTNNVGNRSRKIIRIHIYDKAATPHETASAILKSSSTGGYLKKIGKFKSSENEDQIMKLFENMNAEALGSLIKSVDNKGTPDDVGDDIVEFDQSKVGDELGQAIANNYTSNINTEILGKNENVEFRFISFKDQNGRNRFDLVKKVVSEYVPTLKIGVEGSTISNVSYSTQQDAALATIMMLRNKSDEAANPVNKSGSGRGSLPLRVIPGQLSLTTMGCPIIEYMQQFFVDLGTGTTIDNLYNVIGITHSITPGRFSTDLKFGFYDAYGSYESAQEVVDLNSALLNDIFTNAVKNFGNSSSTAQSQKPDPQTTNPTTGGNSGASSAGSVNGANGNQPSTTTAGKTSVTSPGTAATTAARPLTPSGVPSPNTLADGASAIGGNSPTPQRQYEVKESTMSNYYTSIQYVDENGVVRGVATTQPGDGGEYYGRETGISEGANDHLKNNKETP